MLKEAGRHYFQCSETEDGPWELCAPIEVAAKIGSADIVAQLIQSGIGLNIDKALDLAVEYGREHVVRVLLGHMTDMNFTMNRSESDPLRILYLWSDRSDSIAHMFLDHGIDYSYIYLDENTLLHLAAEYGKVNLVERLLSLGHAVDQENDHGCTPLHSASSIDVKRVLLAAGANVNERGDHGLTPLHTATERGVIEETELLLQSGASISALTDWG